MAPPPNGLDSGSATDEEVDQGGTSYTFTCGKIDAGIAVLIGSHAHLIEFPSLLLPPGCEPGSIVNITCARNLPAERAHSAAFWDLQKTIVAHFGTHSPAPPQLRVRNVTQTSVTLEWDRLELATSKLCSLAIWRNGQRVSAIPNPHTNLSTKLSGLDVDTEYTFHLVLKTTAGTFNSPIVRIRTHNLNDTSGINVCLGAISPPELADEVKAAVEDLKARWTDRIQIDTTHFVCTSPSGQSPSSQPTRTSGPQTSAGVEYQRALQLSIPVVQPSWILACRAEQRMISIGPHYLGNKPPPLTASAAPSSTQLVGPSGAVRPPNNRAGSSTTGAAPAAPPPPAPPQLESQAEEEDEGPDGETPADDAGEVSAEEKEVPVSIPLADPPPARDDLASPAKVDEQTVETNGDVEAEAIEIIEAVNVDDEPAAPPAEPDVDDLR